MIKGDEHFDWGLLVPRIVNPTKVVVIEALWWIGEPLSATDLARVFFNDGKMGLSHVSYHLVTLARAGVLTKVRQERKRGAMESFYFFPPRN